MNNLRIEKSIEMVALQGETSEDLAAEYQNICNRAYGEAEIRYSSNVGEMLRFAPSFTAMREIKGKYFVEIEREFYSNSPKEDDE